MQWMVRLLLCSSMLAPLGCGATADDMGPSERGDIPLPDNPATAPRRCPGICVPVAPATYTGPSLFWLGPEPMAPQCPPETPLQGIEGHVLAPARQVFARECLVTPSDLCDEEGLTCVPAPPENYEVCIHHVDEAPSVVEYLEVSAMEAEGHMHVTLFCAVEKKVG